MAVPPPLPSALPGDPAKPALRAALKARRAAFVSSRVDPRGDAEAAAARIIPHIPAGAIVGLYLSLKDELDPEPLALALHARGTAIADATPL